MDTVVGTNGVLGQWEMLVTPVVQKVNTGTDAEGEPTHLVQFTNWAWNMEWDLATEFDILLWELDTDTQSITQADLFNDTHASVTVCPITSEVIDAPLFRVAVPPGTRTGLRSASQVMVDKIVSVPRTAIDRKVGGCDAAELQLVDDALRRWLAM